ncbi:MAG: tetratricopeptide repeat protein [Mariniblastus sp.]
MKTLSSNLITRLLVMFVCLAVALMAVGGCESEKAKWNLARADLLLEQGKIEEAIALMHTVIEQAPDDSRVKLHVAQQLAENGRGEMGVCLCQRHLQNFPNDLKARETLSTCLRYTGKYDEALVEFKKSLSDHVGRSSNELNALAYYRALANMELTRAAEEIQEAIQTEDAKAWNNQLLLTLQVRTTVCTGLISRHTDQRDDVFPLLNQKISVFEAANATRQSMIRERITKEIQRKFPFSTSTENGIMNARIDQEQLTDCLGALLAVRALFYEDLGKFELADADRRKVEQIGFDFDKLAADLPSDQNCIYTLRNGVMFLDTRGFVFGRQPWKSDGLDSVVANTIEPNSFSSYSASIDDLDVAVLASEVLQKAIDGPLFNTVDRPVSQIMPLKRLANRLTAVLLQHRMEVHERGGRLDLAKVDEQKIEALGIEPDSETLF